MVLKRQKTGESYASLSVKLHACLMGLIEQTLANELHSESFHPFSILLYKHGNETIFRLSVLHERMAPLIYACLNAKTFHVSGIPGGVETEKIL